jgi:hypothetical protein
VIGKGTDAQLDTRQIQALARAEFAADGDLTLDITARHVLDDQLHQAVVQEQTVARSDDSGASVQS